MLAVRWQNPVLLPFANNVAKQVRPLFCDKLACHRKAHKFDNVVVGVVCQKAEISEVDAKNGNALVLQNARGPKNSAVAAKRNRQINAVVFDALRNFFD